jgi:hypothetical protein
MPRKFNVYSPIIVVVPGESFEWVLNPSEANSVTVQPVSSWPLTQNQYSVIAGTPLAASVSNSASAGSYSFTCNPAAPNVTSQQLVVAARNFVDVCSSFTLMPGDYFIWKNDTGSAVTITPDPGNPDFWPFEGQSHTISAHGHKALQIPATADTNKTYNLVVAFDGGGGCPAATQPKLIVGGSGMGGS